MPDRVAIKYEAKGLIRTGRVPMLAVAAIVILIGMLLSGIENLLESGNILGGMSYEEYRRYLQMMETGDLEWFLEEVSVPSPASSFFSILSSLFTIVLMGGYYIYCMGIRQRLAMPYTTLADGLSVAGRLILCHILMYIKILLWAMLFIVPGLIASYRYRFAIYNLLTDDSLSASEAIRLSCEQTNGMKGSLFVLDLSFVGWSILSNFTLGLLNIWLLPYQTLCDLAYFEIAQQNLGRSPYGTGNRNVPPGLWQ